MGRKRRNKNKYRKPKLTVRSFLDAYAKRDTTKIPPESREKLMLTCFYYIDDRMKGYFVPKELPHLVEREEYIHYALEKRKGSLT